MTAMSLRLVSADDSFQGCSGANCAELDCRLWPPVAGVDRVPFAPSPEGWDPGGLGSTGSQVTRRLAGTTCRSYLTRLLDRVTPTVVTGMASFAGKHMRRHTL